MTTIVGIFDTARDLDEAVERLAESRIEDTVFDEAIVAEEADNAGAALGKNRPSARRASHPDPAGVPRVAGKSAWLITRHHFH